MNLEEAAMGTVIGIYITRNNFGCYGNARVRGGLFEGERRKEEGEVRAQSLLK